MRLSHGKRESVRRVTCCFQLSKSLSQRLLKSQTHLSSFRSRRVSSVSGYLDTYIRAHHRPIEGRGEGGDGCVNMADL